MTSTLTKPRSKGFTRDVRTLQISEVCELGDWLTKYMRLELEQPPLRVATELIPDLLRNTREYVDDLGMLGVKE